MPARRAPSCIVAALAAVHLSAQAQPPPAPLTELSLEQLASIEVTSVSRRAERLADAPAAIYVISGDDIRRAGATSLPEALRLAPNLQVAQTNASSYAISARGFNNTIGNKLLVLIDGRTIYTPLFSGVFWNAQEVMLEDVERIEVISGPGATLWGANAVSGVINVITRPARETQGGLVAAGAGNLEHAGAVRYGGRLGANGHFRVYGRGFERQNTDSEGGAAVRDGWNKGQAGFRADWNGSGRTLTLQGDLYRGDLEQAAPGKTAIEGANLVGRWEQPLAGGAGLRAQAYYDRTVRDQPGAFREELDIFDAEFQHALAPIGAHGLLWGGGYRYARDRVRNSAALAFLPAHRSLDWANVFVQDEIGLRAGLELTVGLKAETNPYTGLELLPSARLAWKPSAAHLLWGALSRAVRAPSRFDREFFIPGAPPFAVAGGPRFRSEISNVAELGYRAQPVRTLSYSVTAFYQRYDHLRSFDRTPAGTLVIGNSMEGTGHGLEAWGTYRPADAWRLSAGLTLLKQDLERKAGSTDAIGPGALGNDPTHQWQVRSTHDLTARNELDLIVRHVGALSYSTVPAYTAVDVRLGWRVSHDVELSLTGRNLTDAKHPEFGGFPGRSELERAFLLRLLMKI